jgi:superfamily II DNA or RNA helicase
MPEEVGHKPPYHVLVHHLTNDKMRNQKISNLATSAIGEGRFPLLISDRKEHLDILTKIISENDNVPGLEIIRLDGDLTSKQRREALKKIKAVKAQAKPVILMSSASLVGEGFDLPALDTLIPTTPLSFEGRMVQYAGRLHRLVDGKTTAQIIDFVDSYSAMLMKMYRNRLKAYRTMGYVIREPTQLVGPLGLYGHSR